MEYIQLIFNNGYTNYMMSVVILLVVLVIAPWLSKGILTLTGYRGKAKSNKLYTPLKLIFYVAGIYLALVYCNFPADIFAKIRKATKIILIALGAMTLMRAIETRTVKKIGKRLHKDSRLVSVFEKIIKIIIFVIAIFFIISELGYNPSGLLASLGIGSVVVALAAQDLGKNLVGGGTILAERPFTIGDWIEIGGQAGTVIDLSMRSIKIREFDGSVTTIPNSSFLSSNVTNWTKIKSRKYEFNLLFVLDTSLKEIENFIDEAYVKLGTIPGVVEDSLHISFNGIADSGYNVLIYLDSTSIAYADFIKFQELVNFTAVEIIEKNGLKLAYPTQTIQVTK